METIYQEENMTDNIEYDNLRLLQRVEGTTEFMNFIDKFDQFRRMCKVIGISIKTKIVQKDDYIDSKFSAYMFYHEIEEIHILQQIADGKKTIKIHFNWNFVNDEVDEDNVIPFVKKISCLAQSIDCSIKYKGIDYKIVLCIPI